MKNKKGFTLIELIVAMALLAFVIMLSSSLFDRAIQNTPKLRQSIVGTAASNSKIEDGILVVKEAFRYNQNPARLPADKPKHYDEIDGFNLSTGVAEKGAPISISFTNGEFTFRKPGGGASEVVNSIHGYFISIPKDSDNVVYNKVKSDDKIFTFISAAYKQSPTASIEKISIEGNTRFLYFDKSSPSINVRATYTIKQDGTQTNLQRARLRFLASPIDQNGFIFPSFESSYLLNQFDYTITPDLFEYIGGERDSESQTGNTESFELLSYNSNKMDYLNLIDRDYAADAVTFNLNGHTGAKNSTFTNEETYRQNTLHVIGLPTTANLIGHFDANLIISKSNINPNLYYSLFDLANKDKTSYGSVLTPGSSGEYNFTWGNNDVRNFLEIGSRISSDLLIPNAFVRAQKVADINNGVNVDTTDLVKPYGSTMYYKMSDLTSSIRFKSSSSSNRTVFIKFNTKNYYDRTNNTQSFPYTLLSYNFDYATGDLFPGEREGFVVYVDTNGFINSVVFKAGFNPVVTPTGVNINDTKLYTDTNNYKFDKLNYKGTGKRDERQDFNILALVRDGNTVKVQLLNRVDNDATLKTEVKDVFTTTLVDTEKIFTFGPPLSIIKNATGSFDNVAGYGTEPIFEISDILAYSSSFNTTQAGDTMNYLYRKYLTSYERENGKFDEWYSANY